MASISSFQPTLLLQPVTGQQESRLNVGETHSNKQQPSLHSNPLENAQATTSSTQLSSKKQVVEAREGTASGAKTYSFDPSALPTDALDNNNFGKLLNQLQNLSGIEGHHQVAKRHYDSQGTAPWNTPANSQDNLDAISPNLDPIVTATQRASQADSAHGASHGKLFSLTVTTKDGDKVEIEFRRNRGTDETNGDYSESSISVKVMGTLSEEEQLALGQLTDKIGKVTDEYRQNGWAELGSFDGFDSNTLSGFQLSIKGQDEDSFRLDYSINSVSGNRSISAVQNGYKLDLNADSNGLYLDDNPQSNSHYQQYQQLILTTLRNYKSGDEHIDQAADYFIQGMNALFPNEDKGKSTAATDSAEAPTEPVQLGGKELNPLLVARAGGEDSVLSKFSSGLPDFDAEFSTPVLRPNEYREDEVSVAKLSFSQTSSVNSDTSGEGVNTRLSQNSEYHSVIKQHLNLAGDSFENADLSDPDQGGQTYIYRTDVETGSMLRSLNFYNNRTATDYTEEQSHQHNRTDLTYIEGSLESHEKFDLSDPKRNKATQVLLNLTPEQRREGLQLENKIESIEQIKDIVDSDKVALFSREIADDMDDENSNQY